MKRTVASCLGMAAAALAISIAPEQAASQAALPGSYAVSGERCGALPYDYPRLRIGMRKGYCAGLAASREDGLQFPRSIVQIPGRDLFVIADIGAWSPNKGRFLLFDPALPHT